MRDSLKRAKNRFCHFELLTLPVVEFSRKLNAIEIREIVQQALTTGYLTVAAENQLKV